MGQKPKRLEEVKPQFQFFDISIRTNTGGARGKMVLVTKYAINFIAFFVDFLPYFLWFNLHIIYAYGVQNNKSKSLSKRGCHNTVVVNYDARAFYLQRTKSHEL